MGQRRNSSKRSGLTASVAAAALVLAGVPTASLALDALAGPAPQLRSQALPFTPVSVDPQLARFVARAATGERLMRFTPAGVAEAGKRSVTVAVRVDEDSAHAIAVRSAIAAAQDQMSADAPVRLTAMRFNLGVARGYESFAQPSALSKKLSDAAIPDLSSYKPAPVVQDDSRFATHLAVAREDKAGSSPRTRESLGEQTVDLGTSYRLTRNIDVTAGLRYSQDRDRIAPVADPAKQDSQAVYIGTQFRF